MNIRQAVQAAVAVVALAATSLLPATAAPLPGEPDRPRPTWQLTSPSGTTIAPLTEPWACRGTANAPHAVSFPSGMGWDARQDCVGAFEVQKVCVQLQQLDYFNEWYVRSGMRCGAETVSTVAYFGRSATCDVLREGTYRNHSRGYAWPDGVQHTADGYSAAVKFCVGF